MGLQHVQLIDGFWDRIPEEDETEILNDAVVGRERGRGETCSGVAMPICMEMEVQCDRMVGKSCTEYGSQVSSD